MFSFGAQKHTVTYGAIIDIGSGSVGVGIVASSDKNDLPEILYTHREFLRITATKKEDRDERMRKLREALFSATLTLNNDGVKALRAHSKHAKISKILVTCSSPWSHTISRTISYDNEERDKITKSLIADLISSAEDEIANTLEESAIIGKLGLDVIERTTVDVRVNGYPVKDPLGLDGTTINLSHITGLIPKKMLDTIEEIHDKAFAESDISVHTYMLVAYCVLRDIFPETQSVCIVDVTSESTEIGIVEDGVLRETSHAPHGSNTLVRALQKKTGGTMDDTLSLLRSYTDGTLAPGNITDVKSCIKEYNTAIAGIFESLNKSRKIPLTLIVTADPQLEPLFCETIPQVLESKGKSTYTVLQLRKNILREMAKKNTDDAFITLGGRFFHKLHGCGEIDLA